MPVLDIQARRTTVFGKAHQTTLPTAIAITFSASAAPAAPLPSRPVLTLKAARAVVTAVKVEAEAESWPCVISVVERDGLPIILERMNDAAVLAGVEFTPGKARTAALFRRESGAPEDAVNGTRPAAATTRGFVLMRGGIPIAVDGHIVGAVGVTADTPDHGERIAMAATAALSQ
jgi:glc operon protein GlcG